MGWTAIVSSKGGCGKTTTAVQVAHWFALHRGETLLVDLDPQGQAAVCLGEEPTNSVYRLLVERRELAELRGPVRENLSLLSGGGETKLAEAFLHLQGRHNELVSEQLVEGLTGPCNVVVDTSPSGLLQEAAMAAASLTQGALVVPCTLDYLGLQGLMGVYELRRTLCFDGSTVIVLPTMAQPHLSRHNDILERLAEFCAARGLLLAQPIPLRDEMREMVAQGNTVWEHVARHGHKEAAEQLQMAYAALMQVVTRGTGDEDGESEARSV